MADRSGKITPSSSPQGGDAQSPRSVEIASGGIDDTRGLMRFGTALIGDLMTGAVSPKVANPVCRTGHMVLRAAEMEQKHNNGTALPLG